MEAFTEYTYWPLKALKMKLKQPEAYLKQTLEQVAAMVRSGNHATQWQLKPEARIGTYADAGLFEMAKDEAAPGLDIGLDLDGIDDADEDEDDVAMEDVPLE